MLLPPISIYSNLSMHHTLFISIYLSMLVYSYLSISVYSYLPINHILFISINLSIKLHTYNVRRVNCCHFNLLILLMCFICYRLCLLCTKLESVEHFPWGKQHSPKTQFDLPEFWKWYAVLFGIHNRGYNTKIPECLGVNMRTDFISPWWKPSTQPTSCCLR